MVSKQGGRMTTTTTSSSGSQPAQKKRSHVGTGEEPPAKKAKHSPHASVLSSAPPAPVPCSLEAPLAPNSPTWFHNTIKMVWLVVWEELWVTLLEMWLKYQLGSNLMDDGRLGTAGNQQCCSIGKRVLVLVERSSASMEGGFAEEGW